MRYWDSSALIPLIYHESTSDRVNRLYGEDPAVTAWILTPVEITSALSRKRRESVSPELIQRAHRLFRPLRENWLEITDVPQVRDRASRILDTHALTAADALQLAAALVATEEKPSAMGFVTLDLALAEAARREGFDVTGPA